LEQEYYSVKVTVSPLGEGRYRSRIEPQAPDGSNYGAGNDFKFDTACSKEFSNKLSAGAVTRDMVVKFGQSLFQSVFQSEVRDKYHALKGVAENRKLKLRICLALHSPELINTPWEFLHDGTNFLIKHGYPVVRVLDELVGAKSSFAPIQTALIAAANPKSPDYHPFNAVEHVQSIVKLLEDSNIHPEVLQAASREGLLDKISSGGFDALYFVGHGEASEEGGQLICERAGDAVPDPLEGSDLAGALRQVKNLRFVYLNSCSTARTAEDNPFQGVAQRLMLDGDVAAVAGMQVDVRQSAGLAMAKAFFASLIHKSPEDAMHAARTAAQDDGYSFGIPALYSYLDAPDQYEKNCLETFLSAGPKSKYALVLPSFFLGYPAEDDHTGPSLPRRVLTLAWNKIHKPKYRYPGETFSRQDAEAAVNVMNLLSRITAPDEIQVFVLQNDLPTAYTHYFLFGSKSNRYVPAVQREFQEKFEFHFSETEWLILDKEHRNREYKVPAPDKLATTAYKDQDDYGVIQKVRADNRVYFLLAGLGARATQGCGWYLYRNWRANVTDQDFAILLKFPGGLDFGQARLIDRQTGQPQLKS
jgi:hypothetical protein